MKRPQAITKLQNAQAETYSKLASAPMERNIMKKFEGNILLRPLKAIMTRKSRGKTNKAEVKFQYCETLGKTL